MKKLLSLFLIGASFISSAQNVGIGITMPTLGRLQVNGSVGNTVAIFGDSVGVSTQMGAKPAIGFSQYSAVYSALLAPYRGFSEGLNMTTGGFDLETAVSGGYIQRFSMWQGGNVSINTDQNNSSLFVVSKFLNQTTALFRGTNYNSAFNLINTSNASYLKNFTYLNGGKPNSKVFINDIPLGNVYIGNGRNKVGINTNFPSAILGIRQVNGRGMLLVSPVYGYNNWEFAGYQNLTYNGDDLYTFYNGNYKGNFYHLDGLYYKASDRRLKNNIKDMEPVLKKLMNIDPVEYEMIYDNSLNKKSVGFLAQQVKNFFPELVTTTGDETSGYSFKNLEMMNYDGFGILSVKAVQEQQAIINNLKENIDTLKLRLKQINHQLNK